MRALHSRRYLISGRVQGVGFRSFAEREARVLGITGWARNLDDGRVEVHANGGVAQLNNFESRMRQGPTWADVRGFEALDDVLSDSSEFYIR